MVEKFQLERAKCPEEVGVDSNEIREFFGDMEENNLEFHSFMVIRGGKVACEFYREPFNAETPHTLYSISKSITSTAVGLCINEGYFDLDTRVVDVFPEYDNPKDERLQRLTVRHLVTMTGGKMPNMLADKGKINWVEDFMKSPWYAEPGTFRYVNENIYMLCAIIVRKTGMSVREFLTPRLFEPLGIDVPFWETDQDGVEAGGWGAYFKLEDLAKLMYCYQQGGKINGNQIIPAQWAEDAPKAQADNSTCIPLDSHFGYGYCFWRNGGDEDSYRADGMFSQFGMVFEKEDALLITMGCIPDEQEARDCIWRHFPKAFTEPDKKAKSPKVPEFEGLGKKHPIDVPEISLHSRKEEELNAKTIHLNKKILLNIIGFPVSVLPLAVTFMTTGKVGNIQDINFTFGESECTMSWTEQGAQQNTVVCGMDGHLRYGTMTLGGIDYLVCSSAVWNNEDELCVHIRPVTTVAKRRLTFKFNGNFVAVAPSSTPNIGDVAGTLLNSLKEILPIQKITWPAVDAVSKFIKPLAPHFLEPVHRGVLVKRKDIY